MENSSIGRVLPINKPKGISSYAVIRRLKKFFPGQKIGHAGTLDPLAEGLLLVLIGRATKRQEEIMSWKKEYEVELVFGLESDTYDLEGEVSLGDYPKLLDKLSSLTQEEVKKALEKYRGKIKQTVPAFSATKVAGQPLYRLARKGVAIKNLPEKEVFLYQAEIVKFSPLKEAGSKGLTLKEALAVFPFARLRLSVSKGFYVRSLVHDLGKDLGVGAVVRRLVRTKIGPYSLKQALSLEEFQASEGQFQH